MNRRNLLFSVTGLILGSRASQLLAGTLPLRGIEQDLQAAAMRVVQEGRSVHAARSVVRLCQLLSSTGLAYAASPAIVQGTIDACERLRKCHDIQGGSAVLHRSILEFERVGGHLLRHTHS